MIIYSIVEEFMEWIKTKSELKFNPQPKTFPIYYNCIYWAYLGKPDDDTKNIDNHYSDDV